VESFSEVVEVEKRTRKKINQLKLKVAYLKVSSRIFSVFEKR